MDDIAHKVFIGLDVLLVNDWYLLEQNVNERTITHKMGEYYQCLFPGWNVDCEYNKNLSGPKTIDIDPESFLLKMAEFLEQKSDSYADMFRRDDIATEDINFLIEQLRNPELEAVEELEIVYFVLQLRDGGKLRKTIQPDLIVHHRGTTDNLVVIETKKSTNKIVESRLYDLVKLMTLVDAPEYQYKAGYFIDIPVGNDLTGFQGFNLLPTLHQKVSKIIPRYHD